MTTPVDVLVAVFAGISTLAAIAAAIIAAYALLGSRADSRARTRPVIVADLRKATLTGGAQMLVLKNYGQSVAREVTVGFDPELPATGDDNGEPQLPLIRERYSIPVPVIAPGQALSNVYRAGGAGEHQVPETLRVTVSYVAEDDQKYSDTFALRTQTLQLETSSTPSDSNDKVLRQIKAVEAIARAIDKA